jgi:PTS system nitrogen regulatory IIA component
MKIADFLTSDHVALGLAVADKAALLDELARRVAAAAEISPDIIVTELEKREELGSTGLGGGIAIPHARLPLMKRPVAYVARLRRPIEFDAVDGKPVDIVALLLLPEGPDGGQIGALACFSRKLRDGAVTAALRRAGDDAEMFRVLTET